MDFVRIIDSMDIKKSTIGAGLIIPASPAKEIEDRDLEIAELLAQKINHSAFFNLFNAFELERIRHFIKSKREGGEKWIKK